MNRIIGIDLGTTNSGAAIVRDGTPIMLPHGKERIIPSVVSYNEDGEWLVGTPARNQYVLTPENTVRSIKRKMGSSDSVKLADRKFSPPEISALILRELKGIAERNLGEEVTDAVITVPAYFSDAARQATHSAGRMAGFNVRRIINEPTAAALAYGLNRMEDQMVLVYDLGGGTFDVSLVELMGGIVEVRASHGDTQLGGDDIDQLLAEDIATWFHGLHGVDLREGRRSWARLLRAAEMAKIQLSSHPYTWIKEEYITEKKGVPLHLEYEASRKNIETLIRPLLDKTMKSIQRVMDDAQVSKEQIDQVLLVGGSTHIPAVWELIGDALDTEPHSSINPEEAVALGAGVQAAIIAGETIDAILVDVTPRSLGIAVVGHFMGKDVPDQYAVLIRRNTTIPVTQEKVFYKFHPGQDTIEVEVYQGEHPIASENTELGKFKVRGLASDDFDASTEVTVKFDLDVSGMLTVTAHSRDMGKEESLTVEATSARMSEAEIMQAQKEIAKTLAQKPPQTPETLALLERARDLLADDSLDDEDRYELEMLVTEIDAAHELGDQDSLDEALPSLLDLLFDLED
ncbi:MAG: Hsp70 family protein [Anaerolineales bacterium]|nr:Hsp70 family protein [Chloroflexota bacterium]MBL7163675.1 Hsp70 family protein [Anaerolineales bacterium]